MGQKIVITILLSIFCIQIQGCEKYSKTILAKIKAAIGYSTLPSSQRFIVVRQLPTNAELFTLRQQIAWANNVGRINNTNKSSDTIIDEFTQKKVNAIKRSLAKK